MSSVRLEMKADTPMPIVLIALINLHFPNIIPAVKDFAIINKEEPNYLPVFSRNGGNARRHRIDSLVGRDYILVE